MNLTEAKAKLEKYGQEHVLKYYDELSEAQKEALLEQIAATDMSILDSCRHGRNWQRRVLSVLLLQCSFLRLKRRKKNLRKSVWMRFVPERWELCCLRAVWEQGLDLIIRRACTMWD